MKVDSTFVKKMTQGLWLPVAVLFLGSLSIGLLVWTDRINEKQRREYVVQGALMDVQIHTSVFHLWLEELIGGNREVDLQSTWREFDAAVRLTETVLNGGETEHGAIIVPLKNSESRTHAESIRTALVELKAVALERLKEPGRSGIKSDVNQRFDTLFGIVLTRAQCLEKIVETDRLRSQSRSRHLITGILSVWTVIVMVTVIGLWSRELRRKKSDEELFSANRALRVQAEELEASNEQLNNEINERKLANEALHYSEARYRALYLDNPTMITTIDADLNVLSANPYCASQGGYANVDLVGLPVVKIYHEDDRFQQEERLRTCLQNPHQEFRWECRRIRKDETFFWVEEIAQAVPDLSGKLNLLIVSHGIAERKRGEEEISRLNRDLAARAEELETVNRNLESFNYTVAHDLKRPLTIVIGYCHALQVMCGEKLDEECREFLREVYDGTWRMSRLVDTLLGFSNQSHVVPRREPVDLSAIARGVAAELTSSEPARRVTFRIAEGITADGDPNLLRIVMENLLDNAWKFSACREEAVIEFGVAESGQDQTYFVRDNGTGFAMADADKMFLPFQRLSNAEECRGSGIGLATVERIILRHRGKLWASGEPGNGATFYFKLGDACGDV